MSSRSKQFLNDPAHVVEESIRGLLWLRPDLMRLPGTSAVVTAAVDSTRVAILTGGGAGHEPAHVGFVGKGLLDGAVSGDVFASPSHKAVVAAITHFRGAAGVLLVVKNYNGDCVNFKIAAEIARSTCRRSSLATTSCSAKSRTATRAALTSRWAYSSTRRCPC